MNFRHCFRCMRETEAYPCPHCGYDPATAKPREYVLRPGTILNGKYVVGTMLGQGGFGITYVGWDLALDDKVAIKEYFPSGQVGREAQSGTLQWYSSPQAETARISGTDLFLKEARKMSRVREVPQVVHVRDLFQQNETAYIVMDFVDGKTLKEHLAAVGCLDWEAAKSIFFPTIRAMEQIHNAGLIHRDLSPDNIMLMPNGSVKILDLGAAKDLNVNSGASSMQVAKGGFSPLEQYTQRGGSGTWTDVYATAATLYYSLTGIVPPPVMDRLEDDLLRWDLPSLMVLPDGVLEALQKAMTILPKSRTQTMGQFLQGLESHTPFPQPEPIPAFHPQPEPKPEPKPQPDKPASEKAPQKSVSTKFSVTVPLVLTAVLVLVVTVGCVASLFRSMQKSYNSSQGTQQVQTEIATTPATTEAETTVPTEETTAPTEEVSVFPLSIQEQTISAGSTHTVAIKNDGTVVATGSNYQDECNVSGWADIIAVSAGRDHTVGLREDGTVVATGRNDEGQCNVSDWSDIVAISASREHTIGLKSDGTVVAAGSNYQDECNVSGWTNIVAVSAHEWYTVGLKADGTVVSTDSGLTTPEWRNIAAIGAGFIQTIGLKEDGTVISKVRQNYHDYGGSYVSDWKDIVAISASELVTMGLKKDGTVVSTTIIEDGSGYSFDHGQTDVSSWENIVAISTGGSHTVGLKADGTVVAVGLSDSGQCNVSSWTDIRIPGTVEPVSNAALAFQHTNDPVSFWLSSGKAVDGTVRKLNSPLINCKELTICVEISNLDFGTVEGEWGLWIRQLDGEWGLAETFDLEGDSTKAHLVFDYPISFDAWTCLCHCLGDSWSFNCHIWLEDASQFHYTWEK